MNTNGVARHYGRIEADERFRLALRAAARDDHEELERLVRSCPKKVYRMNDAEFADRGESARLLAVLVVGEIRPHFARASLLRASAEVTRRALMIGVESALEVIAATFGREFAAAHAEEFAQVAAADADAELVERWRGTFAERWGSPA